ncbi:MAG TPA: hypothetical protein VGM82_07740 [Gemmatimonadaceae bacterium]|jgi:hypothetical protein
MTSPTRFIAVVAALLLTGATVARSQDSKGDSRTLVVGIRTATAYEKNPLFVTGGPDDISAQVSGVGGYVMSLGRTDLTLGGQLDRSFYKRIEQLNRFTYAGAGTAHVLVSPRLNLQATASYATLVISNQSIEAPNGPVPVIPPTAIAPPVATTNTVAVPSTIYHTLSAAGSAAYAWSERTTSQVQTSYNQVRFDTAGVPDGSTFSAGGTVQHLVSEHGAVGLVYQFQTNGGVAQAGKIHTVLGSWGSSYDHVDLGVQLGVLANATQGQDAWTAPGGGAQFRYRVQRGSIDLRYDRSAAQAFGVGKILITDQGTLGVNQTFGKYGLHATGSASHGHDTENSAYRLNMYAAEAGLDRAIKSTIRLSTSVYYRRRSEFTSTDDNGVRLFLNFDSHYF